MPIKIKEVPVNCPHCGSRFLLGDAELTEKFAGDRDAFAWQRAELHEAREELIELKAALIHANHEHAKFRAEVVQEIDSILGMVKK